jgi:hypothetical protein
VQWQDRNGSK